MNNLLKPFVQPQRKHKDDMSGSDASVINKFVSRNENTKSFNEGFRGQKSNFGSRADSVLKSTGEICHLMYRKKSSKKNKTWGLDAYGVIESKTETTHNYEPHNKLFVKVYNFDSGNHIAGISIIDDSTEYIANYGNFEFQFSHYLTSKEDIERAQETLKIPKTAGGVKKGNQVGHSNAPSFLNNNTLTLRRKVVINENQDKSTTEISDDEVQIVKKAKLHFGDVNKQFIIPFKQQQTKIMNQYNSINPVSGKPLFDKETIDNALVMNKANAYTDVEVVVDPVLSKILREHQRFGVQFMYDCIMNVKSKDISGCLLADEMGLGKTLMTITVIWTLLKQSPTAKLHSFPHEIGAVKKILIVCPVSLINNWRLEFKKWLGNNIGVKVLNSKSGSNSAEKDKQDFQNFLNVQKVFQVAIISYEKVLSLKNIFEKADFREKVDLLVCDEAHKLKNNNSKILQILKGVDFKKKILLTGTPIQNDLQEFYTICDFLNPCYLGNLNQFKKNYIIPITKARNTESRFNKELVELGEEKSNALIEETSKFILRRTNEILNKFLPPKRDYIIFCKPTEKQIEITENILSNSNIGLETNSVTSSLGLITLLKKICNTPSLLQTDSYYNSNLSHATKDISRIITGSDLESGKMRVLDNLIFQITSTTSDKIVIISNYTQTLDIIQDLLKYKHKLPFTRLDGSTPAKLRPSIVKDFNTNSHVKCFLLSAKSGGMGLNLIGGNRLILFDNDWNPAIDQQAMGRVHRDGQKKECFIYRLVSTGMIDEKILQRQVTKINLSKKILNDDTSAEKNNKKQTKNDSDIFDVEDLRDLFSIKKDTRSNTHDLICDCKGDGKLEVIDDEADDTIDISLDEQSFMTGNKAQGVLEKIEQKQDIEKKRIMKQCFKGYSHYDLSFTKQHRMLDNVLNDIAKTDITFVLEK